MKKLAIITTHPIQYYAPVFKLLCQRNRIDIKVFYTWGENSAHKFDPGFNKTIDWDIPLFEGYPYEWVNNTSRQPGSHHFKGIMNPDLTKQVESWQPDALLVYGWAYHGHLKAMRYFHNKITVLFRGDSTLLDEQSGIKDVLKRIFLKWVYSYADHVLYVGTNSKAYFKKYGLRDAQLSFAPHAVDNGRFAAGRVDEVLQLRAHLNIVRDDILVLFAGKLEEKKDPGLLLEAFTKNNLPNVHLLFSGDGALADELKLKARHFKNIHFIGFQNQNYMPVVYQACDIFCLPSKGPNETWGLAINEAMACGKVILTTDKVGAAIDLVKPGVNGAIFKAGSLTNLRENLTALIKCGKHHLYEMGKRSKELITDWNFDAQATIIEETVINQTSPRRG